MASKDLRRLRFGPAGLVEARCRLGKGCLFGGWGIEVFDGESEVVGEFPRLDFDLL